MKKKKEREKELGIVAFFISFCSMKTKKERKLVTQRSQRI